MYREPAIRELHTQGAKGQGIEIKYIHKAVKWNTMHVQVQRTSLEQTLCAMYMCVCVCACVCVCVCRHA